MLVFWKASSIRRQYMMFYGIENHCRGAGGGLRCKGGCF